MKRKPPPEPLNDWAYLLLMLGFIAPPFIALFAR